MDQSLQTFNLFGGGDLATQIALAIVVLLSLAAIGAIYIPIGLHVVKLRRLGSALATICSEHKSAALRRRIGAAFQNSPVRAQFDEFRDRWTTVQDVSGGDLSSVRLAEVLNREPLLAPGPRAALMPHLPRILLGATVLGALVPYANRLSQVGTAPVALVIPVIFWGLGFSLLTFVASRWLDGTLAATASQLDRYAERAYPAAGEAELAAAFHRDQLQSIERLQTHVTTLGRGARRGGANAAADSPANVDVDGIALELSRSLSAIVEQRIQDLLQVHRQEVGDQRAVVTSLEEVASSARRAADSITGSAQYLEPLLDELKGAGHCLERTAREVVSDALTAIEQNDERDARLGDIQTGVERISKQVELALTAPVARGAAGAATAPVARAAHATPAAKEVTPQHDDAEECEQVLRELEAEEQAASDTAPEPMTDAAPKASGSPRTARVSSPVEPEGSDDDARAKGAAKASSRPAETARASEAAAASAPQAAPAEDEDADIDRAVARFLTPVDGASEKPAAPAAAPPADGEAGSQAGGGGLSSLLTRR